MCCCVLGWPLRGLIMLCARCTAHDGMHRVGLSDQRCALVNVRSRTYVAPFFRVFASVLPLSSAHGVDSPCSLS